MFWCCDQHSCRQYDCGQAAKHAQPLSAMAIESSDDHGDLLGWWKGVMASLRCIQHVWLDPLIHPPKERSFTTNSQIISLFVSVSA